MTQKVVPFEGSTACMTKRAYRNRWNKEVLARAARRFQRSLIQHHRTIRKCKGHGIML